MENYDESVKRNHNTNWIYISNHPDRILTIGGWGSGKTNVLLNLIKYQGADVNKIYFYVQDESSYQLFTSGIEKILKGENFKVFIDHSQTFHDVYKNWKTIVQQRKEKC